MAQKLGDFDLKHSFCLSQFTKIILIFLHNGDDSYIGNIRQTVELARLANGDECLFRLDLASMPNSAPRRLSLEATYQFQEIYQEEFGESFSDDDAQRKGVQLLNLFAILAKSDGDRAK